MKYLVKSQNMCYRQGILSNHLYKRITLRIYLKTQSSRVKKAIPIKYGQKVGTDSSPKNVQTAKKHTKTCSTSFAIKKMQIKPQWEHYTLHRMDSLKQYYQILVGISTNWLITPCRWVLKVECHSEMAVHFFKLNTFYSPTISLSDMIHSGNEAHANGFQGMGVGHEDGCYCRATAAAAGPPCSCVRTLVALTNA